ncbi:MAG: cyclic nucleotide-binding domain-containing protein [SAR324 cluster bacterium]|nr:cyclic nucleotide-binding domain-containing protein [SAR324 cluster bacterium]
MSKEEQHLFIENHKIIEHLKQSRLFGSLDETTLQKIVPLSRFVCYPKGAEILKEGQKNTEIYFILRGIVSVYAQDEQILQLQRLGDLFGEISIICDQPCSETIIADTDVELFCFQSNVIGNHSELSPEESQNILNRIFVKILTEKLSLTTYKAQQSEKTNQQLIKNQQELLEAHSRLQQTRSKLEMLVKNKNLELQKTNEKLQAEITERKNLEQERDRLEKQLRHTQKMEALETLAGGIAHEFNNLLQGIFIGLDIANFDMPHSSHLQQPLRHARSFCERAKHLVKQIVTFSGQEDSNHQILRINPLVQQTLKEIQKNLPPSIDMELKLEDNQHTIWGNSSQIQQVIANLCDNAEYAMRKNGGRMEVSLHILEIDTHQTHEFGLEKAGPYLHLTVSDTGEGLSPDILERIFDPFFTTKPVGDGSGLGLSIVHGIMQNSRGAVTVESKVGTGTKFHTFFPLIRSSEPVPATPVY